LKSWSEVNLKMLKVELSLFELEGTVEIITFVSMLLVNEF